MTDSNKISFKSLVNQITRLIADDRGDSAKIRAGMTKESEHRAYAFIVPLLPEGAGANTRTAVLRTAALMASHPSIENDEKNKKVGQTFREISTALAIKRHAENPYNVDPRNPDNVAVRLSQLADLDLEECVLAIHRILSLADDLDTSINYSNLMKMLVFWGNGVSVKSLETRRQPLLDYYRYYQKPAEDKEKQ